MRKLILASRSPYRAALLGRLGFEFEQRASSVDERRFKGLFDLPGELAATLAREKALDVHTAEPRAVVIGSDQVCALGSQRFDQPGSVEQAIEQLSLLSGRTHELHTAVTVLGPEVDDEFVVVARMTMRRLGEDEIRRVVEFDQPLDCAGSYKLESRGITLFERIECDDHTAIEGLPLLRLSRTLRTLF